MPVTKLFEDRVPVMDHGEPGWTKLGDTVILKLVKDELITARIDWVPCRFAAHRKEAMRWMFEDINRAGRMERGYLWTTDPDYVPQSKLGSRFVDLSTLVVFLSILGTEDVKAGLTALARAKTEGVGSLFQTHQEELPRLPILQEAGLYELVQEQVQQPVQQHNQV